jgi:hypothetical protein
MMEDSDITISMTHPVPPQMIADIAYGLEEPVDIAFRYGYKASEYYALEKQQQFLTAVQTARSELERTGHGVKVKAQWMTENLMDDMYMRAKAPTASIQQVQESIKILSKLADLEPRGVTPQNSGPGFSVVINIPSMPQVEKVVNEAVDQLKFPKFTAQEATSGKDQS